jgi:hypothetical protein
MDDGFHHRDDEAVRGVRAPRVCGWEFKDGVMNDDRDRTIATATVAIEETPYGVRINTGGHALRGDEPLDRGGLTGGDARDGATRAAGVLTP